MRSRLLLQIFAAVCFTFFSCSSDVDAEIPNSEVSKLVGKWVNDGTTVNHEDIEASGDLLEFNVNGTMKVTSSTSTETGTFILEGDQLTLTTSTEMTFELKEVTVTELILFLSTDYDGSGDMDDVEVHFTRTQ